MTDHTSRRTTERSEPVCGVIASLLMPCQKEPGHDGSHNPMTRVSDAPVIYSVGTCGQCHQWGRIVGHGVLCRGCFDELTEDSVGA